MVVSEHHSREDAERALRTEATKMFEIAGGVMRKLLIAAVLSVACAGDASAMTGAELQKVCRDINVGPRFGGGDQEWFDLNYCIGYLAAAFVAAKFRPAVCVPDGG